VSVNVPPSCNVADVDVFLDIQHTWISDLDVFLTGPAGQIPLFQDICPGVIQDVLATLSDEAPTPIGSACPPAGGTFDTAPPDGLLQYEGEPAAGNWTLTVTDDVGGDTGSIRDWGLIIQFQ
jgi:subtilisin-like proprotein convertase family protein